MALLGLLFPICFSIFMIVTNGTEEKIALADLYASHFKQCAGNEVLSGVKKDLAYGEKGYDFHIFPQCRWIDYPFLENTDYYRCNCEWASSCIELSLQNETLHPLDRQFVAGWMDEPTESGLRILQILCCTSALLRITACVTEVQAKTHQEFNIPDDQLQPERHFMLQDIIFVQSSAQNLTISYTSCVATVDTDSVCPPPPPPPFDSEGHPAIDQPLDGIQDTYVDGGSIAGLVLAAVFLFGGTTTDNPYGPCGNTVQGTCELQGTEVPDTCCCTKSQCIDVGNANQAFCNERDAPPKLCRENSATCVVNTGTCSVILPGSTLDATIDACCCPSGECVDVVAPATPTCASTATAQCQSL